jgi:hypothetical protein
MMNAAAQRYLIKRPFWSLFERTFRILAPDGGLIMLVRHPIWKMREEFTVWADEARTRALLKVKARQMVAINYSFDVTDATTGQVLGAVQKQGFRSLVRDKFLIFDATGMEIGYMEEQGASLLRRFVPLLTSKHGVFVDGVQVATMRQIFRFFTKEFEVELAPSKLDSRFVLACALLAVMAEARREDRN